MSTGRVSETKKRRPYVKGVSAVNRVLAACLTNAEQVAQFCPGAILGQRAQHHHGRRHHGKIILRKTFERKLRRNPQALRNFLRDSQWAVSSSAKLIFPFCNSGLRSAMRW